MYDYSTLELMVIGVVILISLMVVVRKGLLTIKDALPSNREFIINHVKKLNKVDGFIIEVDVDVESKVNHGDNITGQNHNVRMKYKYTVKGKEYIGSSHFYSGCNVYKITRDFVSYLKKRKQKDRHSLKINRSFHC